MGLFDQAQQLIPGMQGISNQYGQANQGFLQDRQALDGVMRNYGGLYDQMGRLYGTAPGAEPPTTQPVEATALPWDLYDDCREDLETTRAELTSERARRIHLEGILARHGITPTTPTED